MDSKHVIWNVPVRDIQGRWFRLRANVSGGAAFRGYWTRAHQAFHMIHIHSTFGNGYFLPDVVDGNRAKRGVRCGLTHKRNNTLGESTCSTQEVHIMYIATAVSGYTTCSCCFAFLLLIHICSGAVRHESRVPPSVPCNESYRTAPTQ